MFLCFLLAGVCLEGNGRKPRASSSTLAPRKGSPYHVTAQEEPVASAALAPNPRVNLSVSAPGAAPGVVWGRSRQQLDSEIMGLLLDRLSGNTQTTYKTQWVWWELFCKARGTNPLRRVTLDNLSLIHI